MCTLDVQKAAAKHFCDIPFLWPPLNKYFLNEQSKIMAELFHAFAVVDRSEKLG